MNVALWIVQALLAIVFLMAGSMKLFRARDDLVGTMAWVKDFSPAFVKLIGALEILGAVGIVLPLAIHVLPVLTPAAAIGFAALMIGAMLVHVGRREAGLVVPPFVLGALASFVAYGRLLVGRW